MRIMIGMLLTMLAGPAPQEAARGQADAPPSSPADWMSDEDGVLELKLAHEEKQRPDGGTLRIDSRRGLVLWEGIPGEFGCKLKVEASFDDVKDITVTELAGFVLELRNGKTRKLSLIPVPHAWWFTQQWSGRTGNISQKVQEGAMRGPDGEGMAMSGGAAGAGTSVKHREIPKPVVADTRKAANAIRAALGRAPLP